jgi:hypothetical protein
MICLSQPYLLRIAQMYDECPSFPRRREPNVFAAKTLDDDAYVGRLGDA